MLPSYHLHLLTTWATSAVRSAHTATGSDNLHTALHLEHVCDDALRAIATILTLAANIGHCPPVFATFILVLLPKATGGWRPNGLFTSVLRVYLRWTRRAVTSSWERGFLQALLIRADCAHLPLCDLEAQQGRAKLPFRWVSRLPRRSLTLLSRSSISVPLPVEDGGEKRIPAAPTVVPDWCVRRAPLSWQDASMRSHSWSWPWLTRSTTLALRRSGGGRHAVPGGRKEPPSVATASACDSLVHGACGELVVSSKKLEIITNDERIAPTCETTQCTRMPSARAQ